MEPSSNQNGNLNDVGKAGSLHEFLMKLHKEYGPVASFWFGTQYTVSIASPELFKQHQNLFDRPTELFAMFEPFITRHSIQYANGADGRARRLVFDKVFNYEVLDIYYDKIQKVADEIVSKWNHAEADDHFPLGEHMFLFAVKAALIALMGDSFKDDKEALAFKHSYDVAWGDMEERLSNPILPKENSTRAQNFKKALATLRQIVGRAVKEREAHGKDSRDFLLIDAIIGHHPDEERRFADAITYTVGGFHTSANLLTWCIYYLCMHEEVQDKVYKEIVNILGPTEPVTHQTIGKLKYLRQVLDETLRCSVLAPWAARYSNDDTELEGHKIPAGTPVIHALGVSMMDEKVWPAPTVFDPERFSEKKSKGRPTIAFSPYGFGGQRKCPGYRFAYVEASIIMVTALQKFRFLLVPGQDVKPQYGLVTHPKDEIWFKVVKRA
ncbi:cytochrome P450 20A1-like isoform X2 [Littorina saxatilis]